MSSSFSSSFGGDSGGSESGSRGIWLIRRAQLKQLEGKPQGYRFEVIAYGASLMPNEIFRYVRGTMNPKTGEQIDYFDGVCTPLELEDLPVEEPLPGQDPLFRKDRIDLIFQTQQDAKDAWETIKQDVDTLILVLNIMDDMEVDENIAIGSPPPADPPSFD